MKNKRLYLDPGLEPADTIRVSKVENENNEGENSA